MFVAGILGNPSMNFLPCSFRTQNGRTKIQHDVFTIFSGEKNLMEEIARVAGEKSKLMFGVRPEDVSIHFEKPQGKSIGASIYVTEPLGNKTIVDIKLGNDVIKTVEKASFSGRPEQDVWVKFKETKLHLFNGATGNCIFHASRKKLLQIA
jgi:ABC-type sugar transport system ATPase subunit